MASEILACVLVGITAGTSIFVFEFLCRGSSNQIKYLRRTVDELNVVIQNKNAHICVLENRLENRDAL